MNSRLLVSCLFVLVFFNAPVQAQEQTINCIQTVANATNERITTTVNAVVQGVFADIDVIESTLESLTDGIKTVASNMIENASECNSSIKRLTCFISIPLSLSSSVTNLVSSFAGSLTIQDSKLVAQLIKIASQSVGQLPLNLLKCIQA